MGYTLPALLTLIKNIEMINTQYTHTRPDRIELIYLLERMAMFPNQASHSNTENKMAEAIVGAYIYCLETLTNEYHFFSPEHKKGRFFDSGSTLYTVLFSHLQISEFNQITDIEKLIYLTKFYYFFHENKILIHHFVSEEEITKIIQSTFKKVASKANRLMHAIPCEKQIDNKMKNILTLYLDDNSHNEDRIFLANFTKFLAENLPAKEKKEISKLLSRTMRIKIGFLLYILLSIESTYIIRSPTNSKLYNLCCNTLNIKHSIQLDNETKLTCLTAFESFINDNHTAQLLEEYLLKNIDNTLHDMRGQLFTMIDNIKHISQHTISSATLIAAAIGALMMAAPTYALGFTFGSAITQTNSIFSTKHFLSNITGEITKKAFHNTGHHLTHFAANIIIDETAQRACAKLFETLGMLIGAVTGGAIGIVIFDVSPEIIHSLCYLCKILFPILQTSYPDFAEKADLQLVDCLLSLPPEVFSHLNKEQLRNTIDSQAIQPSC